MQAIVAKNLDNYCLVSIEVPFPDETYKAKRLFVPGNLLPIDKRENEPIEYAHNNPIHLVWSGLHVVEIKYVEGDVPLEAST